MRMKLFTVILLGASFCFGMEKEYDESSNSKEIEYYESTNSIDDFYSGQNFANFDIIDQNKTIKRFNKEDTEKLLKIFRGHSSNRNVFDEAFPFYLPNYNTLLEHASSFGIDITNYGIDFSGLGQNLAYFSIDENSTKDIEKMSAAEALGILEQLNLIKQDDTPLKQKNIEALHERLKNLGIKSKQESLSSKQ